MHPAEAAKKLMVVILACHVHYLFQSASLPRVLAQSPTWASASSCSLNSYISSPQSCFCLYSGPSCLCPPRQGHPDTGNVLLELLPGFLLDSWRQPPPGSKAAQSFLIFPQVFLVGTLALDPHGQRFRFCSTIMSCEATASTSLPRPMPDHRDPVRTT